MKLCRFQPLFFSTAQPQATRAGSVEVYPEPLLGRVEGDTLREIREYAAPADETGRSWPLAQVKLLPPVTPTKVVCVGRNYLEHAAELNNPVPKEPLIFLKPPSAVIGPEEPIVMPRISNRVDYEGELAVVIGRRCSQLRDDADATPCVLGYTCLNDVTARDLQKADGQFTRGKGFDTFCPIGPVIETQLSLREASVETYVNGQRRQFGRVSDMIFPVHTLIPWISRMMTLLPGDVVATGTPSGVGPLAAGDVVEVVVRGVGTLRNPVVAQQDE